MLASVSLLATASPPCTLNIPAHNVHYDLRGVPGVSGIYQGSSDRSVNEGLAEASELLSAGHRSQPWFDITSYDVGQMRGLLMSSTVRVGVCVNATLDQKPADAMLEKCVAMLPEGAAFLSYGTRRISGPRFAAKPPRSTVHARVPWERCCQLPGRRQG